MQYRIDAALMTVIMLVNVGRLVCVFTPEVEISQGRLRGLRSVSGQYRYYGIPYAVSNRFQPPRDPPKWDGTFNAVRRLNLCAQKVSFLTMGQEECLQLDVYSPESSTLVSRYPVLVFLHGGGYYYGTKAHYDPEFLVTKGVVVVIINYRVGVLGFLCVNGIANLGLKDQVAALKWIRKNIAAFGGDPDNVTISGQSAGASAAAMHLLSKTSKGLFHKAIFMSGSALSPWAFNLEPLKPAFEDASKINRVKTEKDVYESFSNASVEGLLNSCQDVSTNSRYFKYSPCVDKNFTDPFFFTTPMDAIKTGQFSKVPMIIGFTNVEGMIFYGINNNKSFKEWDENFEEHLSSVFSWLPKNEKQRVAKQIRLHYFENKRIDRKAVRSVVQYYSDWIAYSTTDAFVRLMTKYSDRPVYSYVFEYEGDRNFAKFMFGSGTGISGASHSDDIFYMFKPAGLSLLLSNPDKLFIDRFTTMLTNFMKYGNPTPSKTSLLRTQWPAANFSSHQVLRLSGNLRADVMPESHKGKFMNSMLCTFGQIFGSIVSTMILPMSRYEEDTL